MLKEKRKFAAADPIARVMLADILGAIYQVSDSFINKPTTYLTEPIRRFYGTFAWRGSSDKGEHGIRKIVNKMNQESVIKVRSSPYERLTATEITI